MLSVHHGKHLMGSCVPRLWLHHILLQLYFLISPTLEWSVKRRIYCWKYIPIFIEEHWLFFFIIQICFLTFLTLYNAFSGLPSHPSYLLPGLIWFLPSLQATFLYLCLFILCHEPLSLNSPVCVAVSLELFFRCGRVYK